MATLKQSAIDEVSGLSEYVQKKKKKKEVEKASFPATTLRKNTTTSTTSTEGMPTLKQSSIDSVRGLGERLNSGNIKTVTPTVTFSSAQEWADSSVSLLKEVEDYYSGWKPDDGTTDDFLARRIHLIDSSDAWRKQYADDAEALKGIDSILSALDNVGNVASNNRKYYSQWKTEDEYEKYLTSQKEYQELINFDVEAGQKEIDALKDQLKEYEKIKLFPGSQSGDATRAFVQKYGQPKDIEDEIVNKTAYLNLAKRQQEMIALSGVADPNSENYDPDFKNKSQYVETKSGGLFSNGNYDSVYEYINGGKNGKRRDMEIASAIRIGDNPTSGIAPTHWSGMSYDQMTDEEIAIYNYYYATEGKEKANEYLDTLAETLRSRTAHEQYELIQGNVALEILSGIPAGLDRTKSGIVNLFSDKDYIPPSSEQILSGMVREDLSDVVPIDLFGGTSLGQIAYDGVVTTSAMAPAILTSTGLSMMFGPSGFGLSVGAAGSVGKVGAGVVTFASAAGNAYQEAINLGYDKEHARSYSNLVGGAEAGLQYLLSGVSSVGGTLTNHKLQQMLNGIDNAFFRAAGEFGGKALSEMTEESLQEILSPYFKNMALHMDEDVNWDEVAYSGLLSVLTVAGLEGPGIVADANQSRYTQSEQAVIDRLYNDRISEIEESGQKVSAKDKKQILEEIRTMMEKGLISINTIAETLHADEYKTYQEALAEYEGYTREYDELGKKPSPTLADQARYTELGTKIGESKLEEIRKQLLDNVIQSSGGTRLMESFRESVRRGQSFEVDLDRIPENRRGTYRAMKESGIFRNSRVDHDLAEFLSKFAAEKGYEFDFTYTEKIVEDAIQRSGNAEYIREAVNKGLLSNIDKAEEFISKYAKTDAQRNALRRFVAQVDLDLRKDAIVDGNHVTLNMDSPKYIDFLVMHEIGHSLTEHKDYGKLQEMLISHAESKGEYEKLMESVKRRYIDKDGKFIGSSRGDIEADLREELASDLMGMYLTGDEAFLRRLSTENRNLVQRILDEIKYLYRLATAGSKEARFLEKLKHTYEKIYRETGKVQPTQTGVNTRTADVKTDVKADVKTDVKTVAEDVKPVAEVMEAPIAEIIEEQTVEEQPVEEQPVAEHPIEETVSDDFTFDEEQEVDAPMSEESSDLFEHDDDAFAEDMEEFDPDAPSPEKKKPGFAEKIFGKRKPGSAKYSLSPVEAVRPQSDRWGRGATTDEVRAEHPTLYAVDEEATEERNPTQVKGTIGSYRKVYDHLRREGFSGSILDASSGLGYGTRAGIEEYGFDVDDIEPYPDKGYKPKYTDYSSLDKRYDAIISNAVLNVLPQDQRDALVVKMGELLNDGGRIFVNVRGRDVLNASGKIPINEQNMEYFIPRTAKTGSYQKGFTKPELVAYLQDALGDGFTVSPTSMFGAVSAIVEKKPSAKYSLSDSTGRQLSRGQREYFKDSKMRDDEGRLKPMYHGSQDAGFHVFDSGMSDDGRSFFFTDSTDVASSYSGSGEIYEARTIRTTDDFVNFLRDIGESDYEVTGNEDSGYFVLDVDGDTVAESENLQDLYTEFCDYMGIGYGDANYQVYLNLTNPLVVDAEGRNWDNISREFSQEVYDRYHTLTAEEKEVLRDLSEYDFGSFAIDLKTALAQSEDAGFEMEDYFKVLASAYKKMGGKKVSLHDFFNVALNDFSEESILENSVKRMNTRAYAERAKEQGYDGVIFRNIVDFGQYGGDYTPATVAVAFDSNQIKSTANENPTEDADIRYSLSEEITDEQNRNGLNRGDEVRFSLSNDSAYMEKAIAMNASRGVLDSYVMETAKAVRARIAERMEAIRDRGLVGLPEDIAGNTFFSNSSYGGSEENTTICPRSLAAEAFVDAVSEIVGRPLTVSEQIYISQDLQGRSMTPECTYCYVATDRKAYRAFLGGYINQRNSVIEKLRENPNADVSRSGGLYTEFLNGRKDSDNMYKRFKMWVDAYQSGSPLVDGSHLANMSRLMGDINSEFGAQLYPQIKDAMAYAQSASWAKKRVNYVAYNGHILKWKQNRIDKLNSHYGLRMYSFSDFHPAFVLENMQMITDAAVRGLKMLGYTKDIDFVDIFAPTGMNINISTFGFESGGNVYENNIIGAEWERAKQLREQYPNVGITFVATNDTIVEWALAQDWIDVVIPYHLVRTGAEVAKAFGYTNYTSESADTKKAEWTDGDEKSIAPTDHNNNKATYLAALHKNNLNPRFERFIDNPNYMKLVNECRQPASQSKPVQPVFNEEAAMRALAKLEANGYYQPIGGSVDRMYEIAAEVAENLPVAPMYSISEQGEVPQGNGRFLGKDLVFPIGDIRRMQAPLMGDIFSQAESFDSETSPAESRQEAVASEIELLDRQIAEIESRRDEISKQMKKAYLQDDAELVEKLYMDDLDLHYELGDLLSRKEQLQSSYEDTSAPIQETVAENAMVDDDMFPDDLAPIESELDRLNAERDNLESMMLEAVNNQDWDAFNQINTEYEAVRERIKALEAEAEANEANRIGSLNDADAPVEMEYPYGEAQPNATTLDNLTLDQVVESVKGVLPVEDDVALREIAQRYANNEISREELFDSLQSEYGSYTETSRDEYVAEVKKILRSRKVKVADYIKHDIPDYGKWMRRNYGKIRFSKDGLAVDELYHELNEMYPDMFPESIYVPSDQLMQIERVANMSITREDGYRMTDEDIQRAADLIADAVDRQLVNDTNANAREAFDAYMADASREETIDAPVADIYNDGIAPEQIPSDKSSPLYEASDGQQAFMPDAEAEKPIPTAEAEKPITRKELHQDIVESIKSRFRERGFDFDEILKKARDLSTFATVDNTPQRVMEKALGYHEGGLLADITVNQVAQNETEAIRWLNSFTDRANGVLSQISRQYKIKPGSKESAAAQMFAEGFYVDEQNNIISYGENELAADFPDAQTRARIKGLAADPRIRQIYDDTLAMINASRTRNAYPEIPRLDNYFLHFRAMDDTFSRLGLPFNPNDIRAKDLPTDLNGVTADLKPGQPYFASAKHRTGKRTSFDLLGGLERYLTSAKNQIYHIDDIQTLRALRNYIAETYGQANGLEGLDELSDADAQERIEQVFNSHLSTFAKFLNEEANVLAGKTALIDRGLEGIIGRRGITFLDTVNRQVGSNMVGYNISSALTNFLSVAQGFAKTNKAAFVKAFGQTVANRIGSIWGRTDGFSENSPVIIRRKGAERFHRTAWQKMSDPGYALAGAVDAISTELIARAKYNEFISHGMDSQQAHYETDKWVSRLMGDRSLGQQPQLYNSKMLGLITKFQLEVRNQLDSQFYDTIQETKASNEHIDNQLARNAKTAAKVASTFVQLAVVQHLFGKVFESIAGYNPAFDIIDVLIKTFGWDDDDEDEDTVLDNIEQGFLALLEDMPYTSTLTGGRIPIESALPIEQLIMGKDDYGNDKPRLETLAEIAPYYVLPGGYGQAKKTVGGLGMFLGDHPIAGSYTDKGNLRFPVEPNVKNVAHSAIFGQWANDNARDYFDNDWTPLNEKQTREFTDSGMSIQEYHEFQNTLKDISLRMENGTASDDDILSYKFIDSIRDDASSIHAEIKEIQESNLSDASKKFRIDKLNKQLSDLNKQAFERFGDVEYNTINGERYAVIGDRYYTWNIPGEDAEEDEASWKKLTDDQVAKYKAISSVPEGSYYASYGDNHYRWYVPGEDAKNAVAEWKKITDDQLEKQEEVTSGLGISPEEYWGKKEEYDYAYEYPENYAVAKATGGYDSYMQYSSELYDIKADKDKNGKSISGSRKEKVIDYINGLDADYGVKIILFKNEYNADDTYNYEIIDYLNSRDDISFEEMATILKKLGFDVDSKGNISW